jgi:hypothetical protein
MKATRAINSPLNIAIPAPPFTNTYSLDYDGVDDYLSVGATFDAINGVSFSCWVKYDGVGAGLNWLCSGGSTSGVESQFNTRLISDGRWFNYFQGSASDTGITGLNDGNWHNLIQTVNYSNGDVKFYKDGAVSATVLTFGSTYSTAKLGVIGGATSTPIYPFKGLVDEFAIFESVLTPAEIVTLSTAPTVDLTSLNPVAWYRMGDNGSWKSPQWLIPSNENKDKVSNYSFQFDGVDDDFTSGDLSSLVDNKSKLSISFWVNLPNASEINRITGKYGGSLTKWLAVTCTSNKVSFVVSNIGSSLAFAETNAVLTDNTWHHVVCVFDGTQATATDRIKIYIDNTNETFGFNGTLPTSTYDFTLEPTNPTWYVAQSGLQLGINELRGKLGEYAIYSDVSLTPSQVNDIYNGGTPNDLSTLSVTPDLWFRMGEEATFSGGVWTVPDSLGSNNGTSNAMTIEDRVGDAPNSENNALSLNMDEVDRVTDTP